jgi:hypothetical protein
MSFIGRYSMLETSDVAKALSNFPIAEVFFIIVTTFLGWITYRKGERDRKDLGPAAVEIPIFLLSGPLANTMGAVHDIAEQSRVQNELLRQLIGELRRNNELLEWNGNQAGMMPPPAKPRGR